MKNLRPCSRLGDIERPTWICDGNLGCVLVSDKFANLQSDGDRDGSDDADDEGPKVRRALSRGPAHILGGRRPESRARHGSRMCGGELLGGGRLASELRILVRSVA